MSFCTLAAVPLSLREVSLHLVFLGFHTDLQQSINAFFGLYILPPLLDCEPLKVRGCVFIHPCIHRDWCRQDTQQTPDTEGVLLNPPSPGGRNGGNSAILGELTEMMSKKDLALVVWLLWVGESSCALKGGGFYPRWGSVLEATH